MSDACQFVKKKFCVDFESDEVKDIVKAVDTIVNRVTGALQEDYPKLKMSCLQKTGSMSEGTRVWTIPSPMDRERGFRNMEFDYLVIMDSWPDHEMLNFKQSCVGFMKPIDIKTDQRIQVMERVVFGSNLRQTAKNRCAQNFCSTNLIGCSFCTVSMPNGTLMYIHDVDQPAETQTHNHLMEYARYQKEVKPLKLNFQWINKEKRGCIAARHGACNCTCQILIEADFHPVIKLNQNRILTKDSELSFDTKREYYLFPKRCTNWHSDCWMMSVYKHEQKLLLDTCFEHRLAYMVLKFIKDFLTKLDVTFRNQGQVVHMSVIQSYDIKTAVLHHIIHCKQPNKLIVHCLTEIMDYFADCFRKVNMQHNFLSYNLIVRKMKTVQEPRIWKMFGLLFQAISDLLKLDDQGDDFMWDLYSVAIMWKGKDSIEANDEMPKRHSLRLENKRKHLIPLTQKKTKKRKTVVGEDTATTKSRTPTRRSERLEKQRKCLMSAVNPRNEDRTNPELDEKQRLFETNVSTLLRMRSTDTAKNVLKKLASTDPWSYITCWNIDHLFTERELTRMNCFVLPNYTELPWLPTT